MSNISIQNGFYGKLVTKKNGNTFFEPIGKAVILEKVVKSIERVKYDYVLGYDYGMEPLTYTISRGKLSDPNSCTDLATAGMDVERKEYAAFCKSITQQEDEVLQNFGIYYSYENLGWLHTPRISNDGSMILCYRSCSLITENRVLKGEYTGNYFITPKGTLADWITMASEEVLPYTPLSIVLLCSMSAITAGILGFKYPLGNGIMHLCAVSSAGKTTAAFLAASIAGDPFMAAKTVWENGNSVEKISLLQSFSSTENALIGKLSGNIGVPIIIDELGKYTGDDLTQTIFNMYDGGSKSRYNDKMQVYEQAGFKGTIITTGEFSLFEKCGKKLEGLYNRVLKIKDKLTVSPEHSDKIKQTCMKNNGRIAPRLAKYILDNGGIYYVVPKYEHWKKVLREILPAVSFKEKFIDTFPALYLTTAEIAKESLGLEFNVEGIVEYFCNYLEDTDNNMEVSLDSYDYLMKEFFANSANFYQKGDSNDIQTHSTVWGRYEKIEDELYSSSKKIVGKYLVRQNIVNDLLIKGGYTKAQCVAVWKQKGLIDYEKGRNTRTRKIDFTKKSEEVFVFYVFESKETSQDE